MGGFVVQVAIHASIVPNEERGGTHNIFVTHVPIDEQTNEAIFLHGGGGGVGGGLVVPLQVS